ncbi:MAG: hypothetical protein AMQ74_01386 [Candidatus Methanofastidiosum methylothiophilum]|uniref:ACR n=1 Tax=Candidatus Methanofastidiosum methylothiophilum TaxID=1705564 RepID=A0A150IXD2_9EURY|nr:MAG: hypothetical protein AMQ74_01386 [Candidatus Methanofastidiosum methylthiophilus]NMC77429.1 DUF192 domain-containing protein [Candidatus Methanofastidiosa archaeon]
MSIHELPNMFDKLVYQKNFYELSRGLMFRKDISMKNEAYIFVLNKERKAAITMMFVFFNIDVVWVNSIKEVIDLKPNVRSFSFFNGHVGKAKYFVEMPKGSIEKYKIKIGDKVLFPSN